jgi:hypothetical protein
MARNSLRALSFGIAKASAAFELSNFGCQFDTANGLAAGKLASLSEQMMTYVHD